MTPTERATHTPWSLLRDQAEHAPDSVLLADAAGTVSRGTMTRRVAGLAAGLRDLGVARDDRVVVQASNRREHIELLFALNAIGAVYCPVHPDYVGDSLRHALDLLEPTAVVVDEEHAARLRAQPEPSWRLVLLPGTDPGDSGAGEVPYEDLLATPPRSLPDIPSTAPALILMTSGTTGRAKGVVLSGRFALSVGRVNARTRALTADDRLFTCYSFCHTNPHCFTLFPALVAGASMAWSPRFSTSGFWAQVRALGATQFSLFTSTMLMLLGAPPSGDDTSHGADTCLSIGTPRGRGAEFEERFGVRIVEPYGMTECGAITVSWPGARRLGSLGRPVDEWDVRVMGPAGELLPAGEVGEIVGRPLVPGMLMDGYFRNDAATLAAFDGLWFHTGDRGWVDADGYFWYAGRGGDVIRRRGENVAALDVEDAARATGLVGEVAAVAVPAPLGEDDVLLVAEARDPAAVGAADAARLRDAMAEHLPRYALPQYVRFVAELERTITGRVVKKPLVAAGITEDTWTTTQKRSTP